MISNCNITVYTGNKKIICMSRKQIKNSTIFSIECSLFELSPGAYHFEKYITNEPVRCHTSDNSVWGSQPCIWNHSLTLTEEKILSQDKTQRRSNHSGLWLIAGIYSVLIVIVVLFMFCINNNLIIRHNVEQDDDSSDKELVEDSSILVLYAKDCVLFMEAMKQFRKILQAEGNYQIFDIHDPERVPDMLKDTQSFWLLNRIKDKKTKIILVTSKCGDFLIRNQESAFKLYKNPSCKDFMYKYAVHILLQDVHSYSYNKLFVLKFNFVEESSSTSCLNQNQRYSLDVYDNVRLLMHDIFKNHDCFEENTTMFKEYVRFDEKCKMLVNYVRDNPDYLSDIFQTT